MKKREAQVRRSEVVFRGRLFRVRRDLVEEPALRGEPAGPPVMREIIEHAGSVVVLPVLADGRVLLVRQYRYAARDSLWELVAGGIGRGEKPLQAARRELKEETGYQARRFERLLSFFPSPGILTEVMHLFRATGLRPGRAEPEADEALEMRAFSRRQLERMLKRGSLRDAKTVLGVLLELRRKTS